MLERCIEQTAVCQLPVARLTPVGITGRVQKSVESSLVNTSCAPLFRFTVS